MLRRGFARSLKPQDGQKVGALLICWHCAPVLRFVPATLGFETTHLRDVFEATRQIVMVHDVAQELLLLCCNLTRVRARDIDRRCKEPKDSHDDSVVHR